MTIWDDRYKSGEGLRWFPSEELASFLGRTYGPCWPLYERCKDLNAAEIGCGNGRNLPALFKYGFGFCATDASVDGLRLARQVLEDQLEGLSLCVSLIQHALPSPLPWPDGRLDLVVDCQTTQHLSWLERADAYKEVVRVLKRGGRFWMMCWSGTAHAANRIYGGCYPELDYVTTDELIAVLVESGLKPSLPIRTTRTYPELGGVHGEWMVVEAVKP